jgi:mycothiol synthase
MENKTFTVRSFRSDTDADLFALVSLLGDVEAFDQEGGITSEDAIRAHLARPGRERWVVPEPDDAGCLIGYAFAAKKTTERAVFFAVVHPAWRRQGAGSALFEYGLEWIRELGVDHIATTAHAKNDAANAFLRQRGFQLAGYEWFLTVPSGLDLAEPEWPAGYSLVPYAEIEDPAMLVQVCNESRRDMWGHDENTPGTLTEKEVPQLLAYWHPEDFFLIFDPDDGAVGVWSVRPHKQEGDSSGVHLIDAPTIIPEHRHRGLHRPSVLAAARHLEQYGPGKITLGSYGDNETTVGIYQEAGFDLEGKQIGYRCDLRQYDQE